MSACMLSTINLDLFRSVKKLTPAYEYYTSYNTSTHLYEAS